MDQILVIDDDVLIIEILKAALGYSGYKVLSASNGEEGIKLLEENHPKLIISDLKMPVMDGNAVAEYVRGSSTFKDTPMIAVTGYSDDIKKGLFNSTIRKPFKVKELLNTVESFIK